MSRTPWGPYETEVLKRGLAEGLKIRGLAVLVGRSVKACQAKAKREGWI
jgi:hypothetical protein